MPQIRYYHHGRYYRPARSMPLLPPLSLVPAVDPSKHHQLTLGCADDEEAIVRRWRSTREKEFRWMVRYIGESLTGENIADMRFLCRDHIQPPDILRETMKGSRLIAILERHRLLAENSLFFLQTLLYYIARPDLYELVLEYRTKRQNDIRKIGVEIMYDMKGPNDKGSSLTKDLKSFRQRLKPRSRFNNVDVQAMMKRMSELKSQMKSKLPKTLDHGYADSVLSATTLGDDSEWEDVDTDNDDGDDEGRNDSRSDPVVVDYRTHRTSAIKLRETDRVVTEEVPRLPKIKPKKTIEITVKTGREGDTESDGDMGNDNETVATGGQSCITIEDSQSGRVQGPLKPVHNFTHRSDEFLDLKVDGKQTYNDEDVIACVRDVNKLSNGPARNLDKMADEVILPSAAAMLELPKSLTTTSVKPVPLKFKTLRRRYRKESPAGRRVRKAVIKRTKQAKPLPEIKSDATQTVQKSSSVTHVKRTHDVPTYKPERVNFLPDIYDKYARKSVSTAGTKASTKTPNSRKTRKR